MPTTASKKASDASSQGLTSGFCGQGGGTLRRATSLDFEGVAAATRGVLLLNT